MYNQKVPMYMLQIISRQKKIRESANTGNFVWFI